MKIAQVALRFNAPGGVETNVLEVARRLKRMGEDVTVYASDLEDRGRASGSDGATTDPWSTACRCSGSRSASASSRVSRCR